jgi:ketosteroid isomerase-like protein
MLRAVTAAVARTCAVVPASLIRAQSTPTADQQIRRRIAQYDAQAADDSAQAWFTKDNVFWSGASSKPLTDPGGKADLVAPNRHNEIIKTTPGRIVVSQAADMAYEYSTFALSFDDDAGHHQNSGALLRVWRQEQGTWKIAAQFMRPYGSVQPLAQGR